ncbi:MAG: hypothetical protein ABJP34_00590 [Erythrobacter sp.]
MLLGGGAQAQAETPVVETVPPPAITIAEPAPEPEVKPEPQPAPLIVPKGHKILISIEGQVGSKISKAKDFFPIKLARPVEVDGVEVLPAGITGEGQVVHAAKGGFAGSAGELILAARYLTHDGRKIPLRSFKWIEEGDEFLHRGRDNTGGALATAAVLGPLSLFIAGGNTLIEPGTIASAKFKAEEKFEGADLTPAVKALTETQE